MREMDAELKKLNYNLKTQIPLAEFEKKTIEISQLKSNNTFYKHKFIHNFENTPLSNANDYVKCAEKYNVILDCIKTENEEFRLDFHEISKELNTEKTKKTPVGAGGAF